MKRSFEQRTPGPGHASLVRSASVLKYKSAGCRVLEHLVTRVAVTQFLDSASLQNLACVSRNVNWGVREVVHTIGHSSVIPLPKEIADVSELMAVQHRSFFAMCPDTWRQVMAAADCPDTDDQVQAVLGVQGVVLGSKLGSSRHQFRTARLPPCDLFMKFSRLRFVCLRGVEMGPEFRLRLPLTVQSLSLRCIDAGHVDLGALQQVERCVLSFTKHAWIVLPPRVRSLYMDAVSTVRSPGAQRWDLRSLSSLRTLVITNTFLDSLKVPPGLLHLTLRRVRERFRRDTLDLSACTSLLTLDLHSIEANEIILPARAGMRISISNVKARVCKARG